MLQRRVKLGETFPYRLPDTGRLVRVKIIAIRSFSNEVLLGIEAPAGVAVALDGSPGDESPPNTKPHVVSIV